MVAATKIITEDDIINKATNKKRRGRPTVLEAPELMAGAMRGQSYRQAVNRHYVLAGLAVVALAIGEDETAERFLPKGKPPKYSGVWEQLGRMEESGIFDLDELTGLVPDLLDDIAQGAKSRDIEKQLRQLRQIYKEARTDPGGE